MLDLFTIFSKGGIVLWYFQGTSQNFTSSVNALIKSVVLQERGGNNAFTHESLTLKYKLDNEFELVFVVAYQKILQLSYIDKLLSDIQIEFRNKYKDDLKQGKISRDFSGFSDVFQQILFATENASKQEAKAPKKMKTFDESSKSKKTVASMIENKKEEPSKNKKKGKGGKENTASKSQEKIKNDKNLQNGGNEERIETLSAAPMAPAAVTSDEDLNQQRILENIAKMQSKFNKKPKAAAIVEKKSPETGKRRGKQGTKWDLGGTTKDLKDLDRSGSQGDAEAYNGKLETPSQLEQACVGQMIGGLRDLEEESSEEEEEYEDEEEEETTATKQQQKKSGGGFWGGLKSLVGSKTLTRKDMEPVLNKMRDHLIGKNVASEISLKLCDSVATKLEGKVLGTFTTVTSTIRATLQEACVQILAPKRRIDILRDSLDAKQKGRPFVITFCGVNGVGKSTNLAKICFWLIENGLRVLIAACDTFRAGAVEQLRTHERKLNTLHPKEAHNGAKMVQLYEKGYGKDAAGIAMEAINYARDMRYDVVLVDTAGRMQDNEPLMRALAKLIKVNQPDLVLFVGEALVGNDAIDQLVKFNQSIADHSHMENPRLIDGIVLTKFDTIDDKVGAAISMTYITGQPIVFVGTGQTYTDLKNLNSKAVVSALLK